MSFNFKFYDDILEIIQDALSLEVNGLMRSVSEMLSNSRVKPGMKLLFIVTEETGYLSSSDAFRIIDKYKDVLKKYFTKIAGVAETDVQYGIFRMVFSYAESYGMNAMVFRSRNDAILWLVQPETAREN